MKLRRILLIIFSLWLAGLLWFVRQIPDETGAMNEASSTEAIVVLTGGSGRLEHGFLLLNSNMGKKLFITGVGDKITLDMLISSQINNQNYEFINSVKSELHNVTLDYSAKSTFENATETHKWMQNNNFTSMRIVTANYHMPRSLLVFESEMPDYDIIADPVFPMKFRLEKWWSFSGTLKLIIYEYHKYLGVMLRVL